MMLDTLQPAMGGACAGSTTSAARASSNLSHDLRSPLTATVPPASRRSEARWRAGEAGDGRAEERRLARAWRCATRATRRAWCSRWAIWRGWTNRQFQRCAREPVDAGELLDDIALRFADRAARQGVRIAVEHAGEAEAAFAALDIELFERAVARSTTH